jgi:hypothetical protein
MAQLVVKSKHCPKKDMCCDEIGLCPSLIYLPNLCVFGMKGIYSNNCQVVKTSLTYMAHELKCHTKSNLLYELLPLTWDTALINIKYVVPWSMKQTRVHDITHATLHGPIFIRTRQVRS